VSLRQYTRSLAWQVSRAVRAERESKRLAAEAVARWQADKRRKARLLKVAEESGRQQEVAR
jgi:EAL domain-containing protein (putative c-di-GMP-specific phosphodiesterase class I)